MTRFSLDIANQKYVTFPFYKNNKELKDAPMCGMTVKAAGSMRFRWNETNDNRNEFFHGMLIQKPVELIHSKLVVDLHRGNEADGVHADGLITTKKDFLPVVTVADCMPLYLYDPVTGVFGVVHSGWKGTGIVGEAIKLAQYTPSACNRQGWKTHVYKGTQSVDLVKWQGGSHGFEEECRNTILVTANLKAFLWHETHQAYIDGGLYAMNLINALHSLGLGCIPLSCGFEYPKLYQLKNFNIPENEVPIVIIAFGNLQDKFNVAVSTRKSIEQTNTFHE